MDKRFFTNINDAVRKTVQSKNMTELGQNLDEVVSEVLCTVKGVVEQAASGAKIPEDNSPAPSASAEQTPKTDWSYVQPPKTYAPRRVAYTPPPIVQAKKSRKPARGKSLGVTLTTLGSVFIPLSAIALVAGGIALLVKSSLQALLTLAAIVVPIFITSIIFASVGSKLRARYRRCKNYLRLTGDANFIAVRQLASETGQTPEFVADDLNKMIRKRMLPNAHLDDQKTCLMLDLETYQQYLAAQQSMRERQEEEERLRQECEADPQRAELYRTIEEGQAYIRQIKEANDAIPNEDISNKLFRLEAVTTRIFEHVEKHPEKLPEISRFMRYYLPTTLKLVNAYREFEKQPVQGENIRNAKEEIQTSLEVINKAFENLLDSLFEDDALDISTDISVLHTMLAQEGLTGSDFQKEKER